MVQAINGDPFIGMLETPVTSSPLVAWYLSNLPAYRTGVDPTLRGVEIGLAHGFLLTGPFIKLGPLRNVEGTAEVAGALGGAGLVVILTVCLAIYGAATFQAPTPSVGVKTLTGREIKPDPLQTADGCVWWWGTCAALHGSPSQLGRLHLGLAGGWPGRRGMGIRVHADPALLLVSCPFVCAAICKRVSAHVRYLALHYIVVCVVQRACGTTVSADASDSHGSDKRYPFARMADSRHVWLRQDDVAASAPASHACPLAAASPPTPVRSTALEAPRCSSGGD